MGAGRVQREPIVSPFRLLPLAFCYPPSACFTCASTSASSGKPRLSLLATTWPPTRMENSPRAPSMTSGSTPVSLAMSAANLEARG